LHLRGGVGRSRWAESTQTSFVAEGTVLQVRAAHSAAFGTLATSVGAVASRSQCILMRAGDTLVLTRGPAPGAPAEYDAAGRLLHPAHIPCTLPEVFAAVRPGESIRLDDGKLAGVIRRVEPHALHIEITQADPKGVKLRADKGINLPDTHFQMPALTNTDLADLQFIAAHADLVGLSYVQCPADVRELQSRLRGLRAEHLGIVLKIETRQAFEQLPQLLLAAMRSPAAGVMIARGDLAVECGWERLAEIQEEILWLCEAAHMPVIWATQVLESLAKTGVPSRAEITDAAMGVRAECVMLNKGPHIVAAIQVLDAILQRMQAHQTKKTSRLRRLLSWESEDPVPAATWHAGASLAVGPAPQRRNPPLSLPAAEPVGSPSGTSSSLPSSS
jgi:pyruvate kinase